MDSILGNVLVHGMNNRIGGPPYDEYPAKQISAEDMEKFRAENEARNKEFQRKQIAGAAIQIAEKLVVTQGMQPETAMSTAIDLVNRARVFMDNFVVE